MGTKRYEVWKGLFIHDPWQVVYKDVETRDEVTGLPLSYTLRALPGCYEHLAEAEAVAQSLNLAEEVFEPRT